jgi:hypothetical protein
MNQFVTLFLTFSIIGIAISILTNKIIKNISDELVKNLKEEHITIHLPNFYMWIGLSCSIFCLLLFVLMIVFPNDTADIWVAVLFGIYIFLGLYIVWATYFWKIHIYRNDEYFIYVTSFRSKHKIQYSDIIDYKNGENYIKLKTNQRLFFIDNKATNIEFLLAMLKKNNVKEIIIRK